MQLTLRSKQRLIDTFSVAINVHAALFSIATVGTAIVSPLIAHVTGDWSGVFPAVAIGGVVRPHGVHPVRRAARAMSPRARCSTLTAYQLFRYQLRRTF